MEDFLKEKKVKEVKKPLFDIEYKTYFLWFFCVMLVISVVFYGTLDSSEGLKKAKIERDSIKMIVNKIDSTILFYPIKK